MAYIDAIVLELQQSSENPSSTLKMMVKDIYNLLVLDNLIANM